MDRETVEVYERSVEEWDRLRPPRRLEDARRFSAAVANTGVRVDLGCGTGSYADALGRPLVGLDASMSMLRLARLRTPGALLVRADLEALPFADRSLAGAWANMSYLHLPRGTLPLALARLHWAMRVGAVLDMSMVAAAEDRRSPTPESFGGRFFSGWDPGRLNDMLVGAGFEVGRIYRREHDLFVEGRRALSLPDTVGPGMEVLVCGLNPSEYAAGRGVGFSRPGNRFWPAAVAAGLVARTHDPLDALRSCGVGMTDLVKRATRRAEEIGPDEYADGAARVERLVRWLRPGMVCFVGLQGWRAVIDRGAVAGAQPGTFGGAPVYLMPSTSGLNAHSDLRTLTEHLVEVRRLAQRGDVPPG